MLELQKSRRDPKKNLVENGKLLKNWNSVGNPDEKYARMLVILIHNGLQKSTWNL